MRYVELVNRTQKTLRGTWDGKAYFITPGSHHLPELVAHAIKRQNPIMGTEDPTSTDGNMLYKLGIREDNDDCSPLELPEKEAIERLDRSKIHGPKTEVVPGQIGGIYSVRQQAGPNPLGNPDTTFKRD